MPKRKRVITAEYKFTAPFLSFRAKSRNLWLFEQAVCGNHSRDVSTPLDMTEKHGHDTSHPSFHRHRSNRITLLVGRSCRCVRLHRHDDAVWNRADYHSSNCACA